MAYRRRRRRGYGRRRLVGRRRGYRGRRRLGIGYRR